MMKYLYMKHGLDISSRFFGGPDEVTSLKTERVGGEVLEKTGEAPDAVSDGKVLHVTFG